ncbi:MAG: hypothetical protein V4727_08925 [Verrucomicrobiota bacterium]
MKKLITLSLIGALAFTSVSCYTSYDAYGNQRQAVDPGVAVAGAAAAGIIAYGMARDRNHSYHNGYHHRPSYHHHHYRSPYYRRY